MIERLTRPFLGVPLFAKLIGANAIIVLVAAVAAWGPTGSIFENRASFDYLIFSALVVGTIANVVLVWLALLPVHELQRVAKRVAQGRLEERAALSPLADRRLALLTDTTNQMLDKLADDRSRMKKLGAEVVFAQEEERAQVARDLHESVAQTLAAARFEIVALANKCAEKEPEAAEKLKAIRELLGTALEEIRGVSQALHPRVAQDLGLGSALQSLAKVVRERSLVDIKVEIDVDGTTIPSPLSATLFRVAREALRGIEQHAEAAAATVTLIAKDGLLELSIADDGCGFDEEKVLGGWEGGSLKAAHERLSLAGGELHIDRTPNGGNKIVARIAVNRNAA